MNNIIAGILGLFLGPVGLWYKGKWAAGLAWLVMGFIILLATGGVGIVIAPILWIGMAIHAFVAAPAGTTAPANEPATTLSRLLTPNRSTIIALIIGFLIIKSILNLGRVRVATPPESPPASGASPSTPAATASSPEKFPRAIAIQTPSAADVASATPPSATYRVIKISKGDYLNVRAGAGSNYPIVTKLEPGTGDIVLGEKRVANGETKWQEMTVSGQTGWVNADYIALETGVSASSSSATPMQSNGFTLEVANKVQKEMTYEQVCSLLGMPGVCADMHFTEGNGRLCGFTSGQHIVVCAFLYDYTKTLRVGYVKREEKWD